jgi:hypothetical protein
MEPHAPAAAHDRLTAAGPLGCALPGADLPLRRGRQPAVPGLPDGAARGGAETAVTSAARFPGRAAAITSAGGRRCASEGVVRHRPGWWAQRCSPDRAGDGWPWRAQRR